MMKFRMFGTAGSVVGAAALALIMAGCGSSSDQDEMEPMPMPTQEEVALTNARAALETAQGAVGDAPGGDATVADLRAYQGRQQSVANAAQRVIDALEDLDGAGASIADVREYEDVRDDARDAAGSAGARITALQVG